MVTQRGLTPELIQQFGLGYSGETEKGLELYQGRLVIPYFRRMLGRSFVVDLKFRKLGEYGAKYLGMTSPPKLFNTRDMILHDRVISICEGELDALTASGNGIPAVGVPGVENWQDVWNQLFTGYERIWILADGDDPGRSFAKALKKKLGHATRILKMPDGMDVNDVYRTYGIEWIKERME